MPLWYYGVGVFDPYHGSTAHKYYDAACRDLNFTTLYYNYNALPKHKKIDKYIDLLLGIISVFK
jgi:hypothetical protein